MSHLGSFAVRVKAARETMFARTGVVMRQADLGKAVGLSGAAVSTWETGDSAPVTELIPKIAQALRVDAAWLAWGEGQSPFQVAPQSREDAPQTTKLPIARDIPVGRGKDGKRGKRAS